MHGHLNVITMHGQLNVITMHGHLNVITMHGHLNVKFVVSEAGCSSSRETPRRNSYFFGGAVSASVC